jgi:Spy/CpxP family protein refolding chaperone
MQKRDYIVVVTAVLVFSFGVVAYAHGPVGGSGGGSMMDGGRTGRMGGHGGGMMGDGQWISELWHALTNIFNRSDQTDYNETESLRAQIREKRRELAEMHRSDNTDKELHVQKIEELNRLESKLDKKMSAFDIKK